MTKKSAPNIQGKKVAVANLSLKSKENKNSIQDCRDIDEIVEKNNLRIELSENGESVKIIRRFPDAISEKSIIHFSCVSITRNTPDAIKGAIENLMEEDTRREYFEKLDEKLKDADLC